MGLYSIPGHDSMLLAPLFQLERAQQAHDHGVSLLVEMDWQQLTDAVIATKGRQWWEGHRDYLAGKARDDLSDSLASEEQQDDCERYLLTVDGERFWLAYQIMQCAKCEDAIGDLIDDIAEDYARGNS